MVQIQVTLLKQSFTAAAVLCFLPFSARSVSKLNQPYVACHTYTHIFSLTYKIQVKSNDHYPKSR
jgi:hypothetical protein